MVQFLKTAMDWVLEKEDQAAEKCVVSPEDVQKQIDILEAKRVELHKKFDEEDTEFGHVLSRLSLIKVNASQCKTK